MKKASIFFICAILLLSCKKGDTGPAGTPGTNGNANVHSSVFTVSTWTLNTATNVRYASIQDPDLTMAIQNNGLVEVYLQSSNYWAGLPLTFVGTTNETLSFATTTGSVEIDIQKSDGTDPNPASQTFKIVCESSN
jgi:hypothetical protein